MDIREMNPIVFAIPGLWFLALVICAIVGLAAFVWCAAIYVAGIIGAHLFFIWWNRVHFEKAKGSERVAYELHSWFAPIANMIFNWKM